MKLMKLGVGVFALLSVLTLPGVSHANVSLKNGNFFIAYNDMVYSGGFETKLERVYNSKSAYKGIFGWGWGNEFEVHLTVGADGSVVVHEFGGGAENQFSPVKFNAAELESAVESLASVAQKEGAIGTAAQLKTYKDKLRSDVSFRNQQWELFRSRGKIQPRQIPTGTQLQSNRFSYQYITKTNDGYVRTLADTGKVERFDQMGRLIRVSDKNGNFVSLEYGADGHVKRIVDSLNRKMFFSYNSHGLVSQVEGESGKVAAYTYNDQDELVQTRDVDGNAYAFGYDSQKRHNLTQITYSDRTTMGISYYGLEQQENVKSVKDRDGSVTEYVYSGTPGSAKGFGVTVKTKQGDRILSTATYQYFTKKKATGEDWTYKLATDFNGEKTETTYNECCGLPLIIKKGKDETAFEYDVKGHVTKKTTPYDVTELQYDSAAGKVSKVIKYPKRDKNKVQWSEFTYDSKGNLTFAKNSEGKGVKLIYDSVGRIRTLIDQNKEQINFKYNEISKPIEISDPALGSINISYANNGEIKEVTSEAGRKIAAQVTASFQGLLDIIRPAGVSLAF